MSLATDNARTAIIELLEGTLPSDFVSAGLFAYGVFDGQPLQAQQAAAVQTGIATHRFDVRFTANTDHVSTPSRRGSKRLLTLGVSVAMWTHVATTAQEADRSTVLADIGDDAAAAMRALGFPHAIEATDDDAATGIVGGLLHGPGGNGFPRWRVVDADWNAQLIRSEIVGSLIIDATVPTLTPTDIVSSVNMVAWLAPGGAAEGTHFSWNDASDYENHFTASGDARPTLVASWLDGHPGVRFDGVTSLLWRSVLTGIGAGSKPVLIFVGTADTDAPQTVGTVFLAHGVTDAFTPSSAERLFNVDWATSNGGRSQVSARLGSTPTLSRTSSPLSAPDDAPHWIMSQTSGATDRARSYFDGALVATASSGAAGGLYESVTQAYIGGGDWHSNHEVRFWKGTLGEVVLFDGMPTAGEMTSLLSEFFAPRWPSLNWSLS